MPSVHQLDEDVRLGAAPAVAAPPDHVADLDPRPDRHGDRTALEVAEQQELVVVGLDDDVVPVVEDVAQAAAEPVLDDRQPAVAAAVVA